MHYRIILALFFFSSSLFAFTVTGFAPSVFNTNTATMDAALGIDGSYTVEGFEDATFATGLTVTYEHPNFSSAHEFSSDTNLSWDNSNNLVVVGGNFSGRNGGATFTFDQGASSFGIGVGQMTSTGWSIIVNGNNVLVNDMILEVANYVSSSSRNGYIKVDAQNGEVINSVRIQRSAAGDRVHFDHLAFQTSSVSAVPEPSSFVLLLSTLVFLGHRARKTIK